MIAQDLIKTLLEAGQVELAEQLKKLQPQDPIQALMLRAVIDTVERHGLVGIEMAMKKITRLIDGEDVDLDLSDIKLASDMLAALQQLEADEKSSVRDMLVRISATIGPVVAGLLKLIVG